MGLLPGGGQAGPETGLQPACNRPKTGPQSATRKWTDKTTKYFIARKKLTNYLILALALVAGAGLASSCGKDYGDDISKLDKRVAAIEQQNLAEVKSQLNQLSSTLNGITGTLSSIQSKNGELEGLVNGLSSTVGSLQSTISGLVSISDFNEFKSSYETEKGELSGQLGTITRTLETLSGKVGDAATKSELDSLNTELGGRIQGLSEKLDAMGLKLDALQASIKSVVFVPEYSDGKVVVPAPVNVVKLRQGRLPRPTWQGPSRRGLTALPRPFPRSATPLTGRSW